MSKEKNKKSRTKRAAGKSVTLQDVADHAGVSTASVSRFLYKPDSIKSERRQRIEHSIQKLDYIPHGAAQALASKKTRTIGAIIPTLHNAMFAQGLQYFQNRLQNEGYSLLVGTSDYSPDEEFAQAEKMMNRGIDGLLLVGLTHKERLHERIKSNGIPYVSAWSFRDDYQHPCVGFKNFEAAIHLTQYLIDLGHRHFGIIAGISKHNDRAGDRLKGYLHALKRNKINIPSQNIIESSYDIRESRTAVRKLISSAQPPTALICGNDVIAYGALFECANKGLKVPDDISIIGFDDLESSSQFLPALTTMRVPFKEMGEKAADYLIERLDKKNPPDQSEIEVELILRNTTAPPKKVLEK